MTASEWKVPRPSGVISSRDLARNTANLLTELKESEHSLLIVRRGLPTAVISSIPDPAWRPRRDGAEIAFVRSEMPYGPEVESDDEDALQVLEGLDLTTVTARSWRRCPTAKNGYPTQSRRGREALMEPWACSGLSRSAG
jgi:hypothetical protein